MLCSTHYSFPILVKFPWQILEKYLNIKFHENLSSESRVVSYGQSDMMKPIDAFHNFANKSENGNPSTV
jgi:hypothetical protein